ncbi:MAG TPA: DUF86 domain-containing protein [candidate division Zixibacteria bacterium]|nr:DUF86 domain-containing protein [candidate division Zixibacteria bacterium]
MNRDFGLYAEDILDAIGKIAEFIGELDFEGFVEDEKTSSAVILQLIIIGEASKNIPEEIRAKYPDVPWSDMARMRDRISHGYFGINLKIIWEVVKKRLPALKPRIAKILIELDYGNDYKDSLEGGKL